MVSDKAIYSLLSALSHFKDEAAGDERCKDVVEQVDSLATGLRDHHGARSKEDAEKPSFEKAREKSRDSYKADMESDKKGDDE